LDARKEGSKAVSVAHLSLIDWPGGEQAEGQVILTAEAQQYERAPRSGFLEAEQVAESFESSMCRSVVSVAASCLLRNIELVYLCWRRIHTERAVKWLPQWL